METMVKTSSHSLEYRYHTSWIQLLRPLTWSGTIMPACAGTLLAAQHQSIHWTVFIVFLIASLLVQMAVNIFNDYFDFQKGQDAEKWDVAGAGPAFSTLPKLAIVLLLVAGILGIWLALETSVWTLVFGVFGVIGGYFYSAGKKALSAIGLGELTAALFLGMMVMVLAYTVQDAPLTRDVFFMAIPFALLIAAMILSNNLRDMEKDKGFRQTLPMLLGRDRAITLLTLLISLPYVWILLLILLKISEPILLLVLIALPIAFRLRWCFRQNAPITEGGAAMRWASYHHWGFSFLYVFAIWLT